MKLNLNEIKVNINSEILLLIMMFDRKVLILIYKFVLKYPELMITNDLHDLKISKLCNVILSI